MDHWNYRVVHRIDSFKFDNMDPADVMHSYFIIEAYYDEKDEIAKITGWTDYSGDGVIPSGETTDELRSDLEMMLKALDAPVLEYDDLPQTEFHELDTSDLDTREDPNAG